MAEPLSKIIPILLLILFGNYMRHRNWLNEDFISKLKLGVVNIALPCVLFLTFKNMALEIEYLLLSLITFIMLIIFYLFGLLICYLFKLNNRIIPFFTTATTFGLLGIPLYEGVYGLENMGDLTILGIGNEFFVWIIYLTLIKQKLGNMPFNRHSLIGFMKSPLIISIVLGLTINVTGITYLFDDDILLKGINLTLESLASLTTPLILLIIGYGIKINMHYLKSSFKLVWIRLIITLGVGMLIKLLVIDTLFDTSRQLDLAYYTFIILPPPYSLAIFVSQYCDEEESIITNNAIVISTILCIGLFITMVLIYS